MRTPLPFPALLRLIDERSVAFRDAISAAPGLEASVPTCPGWTVLDLAHHLGSVHRRRAVIVSEGPSGSGPEGEASADPSPLPSDRDAVLRWSAESTVELLTALSRSGPDTGCWTWWGDSPSPQTSGAVARHQLVEVTVHTYDAQVAAGERRTLSQEVAVDGTEEFLSTSCSGTAASSRRLCLLGGGASDVLLALYGRVDVGSLTANGDGRVFDQLIEWDPDA
jgi:uncharacterized protein (TIGR03083 family)